VSLCLGGKKKGEDKMAKMKVKLPNWLENLVLFTLRIYHTIRLRRDVRIIPLTKRKFAIVDPADYLWLINFNWHVISSNGYFYPCRRVSVEEVYPSKTIQMNREILNAPPDLLVDHINHDTLDNRRCNLRPATYAQNGYNRRKLKKSKSSIYKGVTFHKRSNRYRATICVNGRSIYLGQFKSESDAAKAYDEAAKKYFGEFACLNFPDES
jgi:hypothetical protein